jgi:hypothetical protein
MRTPYFTLVLTAIVCCLVHFGSDAAALESKRTPAASGLKVYSDTRKPSEGRASELSRGTQKWQTYASAACGDHGKGEMYGIHFGYGYFLMDCLSVNIDLLGAYIRSGIDDNGGLQQQSTNFSGSRRFNFRIMGGGGGTLRVANKLRILGGMRYLHISDAGIEGGGGGFDGFMFYAGAMFSF